MRHYYLTILSVVFFVACNEAPKETTKIEDQKESEITEREYPEAISKVFEAHGGLDSWNDMQTLAFTMEKEEGKEVTTTDLKDRRSLIETEKFKIGYDGEEVWLDQDSTYFNNDPKFYYNLMFYFYAMPFVLADDGIIYSDVEPLRFEDKSYPGIKVSYASDVGMSPDDEYVLYYNPDNGQMEWLSYTVTYFDKAKSDKFSYIKYDQWQEINGLKLPKTLQWYNFEGDSLTTMRNERDFSNIKLMKEKMDDKMYVQPVE